MSTHVTAPHINTQSLRYPSKNPNQNITTKGAIATLITSIVIFFMVQAVFEYNRYYKQIYLKRLQKRFEVCCTSLHFKAETKKRTPCRKSVEFQLYPRIIF